MLSKAPLGRQKKKSTTELPNPCQVVDKNRYLQYLAFPRNMLRITCDDDAPEDRPKDDGAATELGGVATIEGYAQDVSASAEVAAGRALEPACEKRGKRPPQDVEQDRWLPEKRQRHAPSSEAILPSGDENSAGHVGLLDIPEEVAVLIFSHLLERDLCRVAKVCRRLNDISNAPTLWKSLFQSVFEYDLPLFHPAPDQFHFVSPDEAVSPNAWKESFRQLYRGIHVRPPFQEHIDGRSLTCTDNIVTALNLSRAMIQPVIFVHAGTYQEELITVDSTVALIGAAPGNVAEKVIIQRGKGSTVAFVEGARAAYLGYLTLNFTPRSPSSRRNRKRCCLQITANCSPTVEHCIVRSTSAVGAAVCVIGQGAEPRLRWCAISDCRNGGLCIADYAKGTYEGNDISRNGLGGVWVSNYASPVMRHNRIHHCTGAGLYAFENGMGYFEANDIHDNSTAGVEVTLAAEPEGVHREILDGEMSGVHALDSGQFEENGIPLNEFPAVWITSNTNPIIRHGNVCGGPENGLYVIYEGLGLIENNIYGNRIAGIQIEGSSDPTVRLNTIRHGHHGDISEHETRTGVIEMSEVNGNTLSGVLLCAEPVLHRNRIHSNELVGVYFLDNGRGHLEQNELFSNLYPGVEIGTGSNPTLYYNTIWGGHVYGVFAHNEGRGVLEQNEVFGNALAGVTVEGVGRPMLRSNNICEGGDSDSASPTTSKE
ncbi:hypothetical protein HPB48_015161 [Haemaphysalis longicornis]|uniref:F-box domain-containing protein n=1 Tax=Haemaphysalis longicornis TaxID=44386 RepID=A0A9J6FLJ1_HAELO|nr:hypothetical protein HPB48_015161 [Haemaphysalis longicornis]